jgi:hypothetical protein
VGNCKPFSERCAYTELIAYENAINKELLLTSSPPSSHQAPTIECICCYSSSAIKQISSLSVMMSILHNHDIIITSNNNNKISIPLLFCNNNINNNYQKIMIITESIKSGIDKVVGNYTSNLILKTMKLVYHIDEESIVRQPDYFVNKLVKVVGKNIADPILSSILDEIKQHLLSIGINISQPDH